MHHEVNMRRNKENQMRIGLHSYWRKKTESVFFCIADPCHQKYDAGPCLAYSPMFYYDRATDRCLKFVYGGCGGNSNRFQTLEACEQRCRIKKATVNGLGKVQDLLT
jgi:hypothetical protein